MAHIHDLGSCDNILSIFLTNIMESAIYQVSLESAVKTGIYVLHLFYVVFLTLVKKVKIPVNLF